MHVHTRVHDADEAVEGRSFEFGNDGGVHGPSARIDAHRCVNAADERLERRALQFCHNGSVEKTQAIHARGRVNPGGERRMMVH